MQNAFGATKQTSMTASQQLKRLDLRLLMTRTGQTPMASMIRGCDGSLLSLVKSQRYTRRRVLLVLVLAAYIVMGPISVIHDGKAPDRYPRPQVYMPHLTESSSAIMSDWHAAKDCKSDYVTVQMWITTATKFLRW